MAEIFIAPQDVQDEIIAAARADERRKVLLEVAEMAEEEARRCDALASGARIDVRWSHQDEAMSFRYLAARLYAKAGEE